MLKLSKLTDYAAVIMAQIARDPLRAHTASELAETANLPYPTVGKTLKMLAKGGLVVSRRGAQGGYVLSRSPDDISASDIIVAIEGPIGMTECSHADGECDLMEVCGVANNWQRVSLAIRTLLDGVTLAQLAQSSPIKLPVHPPIQSVTLSDAHEG
ncbi:SUF system Fe-S cluster assembly regulator [Salinicola aestuarinus]|uniref:SUF system Fe-S cluster assembly regulator n=1 Tax=Salinicola aestuarinus TaxID=1949082 RepID=UPI000DA22BAE|nr:SUF system Fe-S cluster assembly regulator [Salinicola aestuarinus]